MWTYEQATGEMRYADGEVLEVGYAGKGEGKNNPDMQYVIKVGPLPVGRYTIGRPYDTNTHGPFVLRLTPHPDNEMHGRAGFLIHADAIRFPGEASEGCIILSRKARGIIADSGDNELEVV